MLVGLNPYPTLLILGNEAVGLNLFHRVTIDLSLTSNPARFSSTFVTFHMIIISFNMFIDLVAFPFFVIKLVQLFRSNLIANFGI